MRCPLGTRVQECATEVAHSDDEIALSPPQPRKHLREHPIRRDTANPNFIGIPEHKLITPRCYFLIQLRMWCLGEMASTHPSRIAGASPATISPSAGIPEGKTALIGRLFANARLSASRSCAEVKVEIKTCPLSLSLSPPWGRYFLLLSLRFLNRSFSFLALTLQPPTPPVQGDSLHFTLFVFQILQNMGLQCE